MEKVNTGLNIQDIYYVIPQLVPVFTHRGAVHNDMYWGIQIGETIGKTWVMYKIIHKEIENPCITPENKTTF